MAAPAPNESPVDIPPPNSSASFWHSEPSQVLLDHRTTPELPEYADIAIVGSGITGASAARFLAEDIRSKNLSVVMLDARQACWCATGRNGGHCQALLFDREPDVGAFEVANYHAIKKYVEDHEVECEWRDVKGCRVFWTPELLQAAITEVERLKSRAPDVGKLVEVVTDEEHLQRLCVKAGAGATLTSGAASLWPYKLIAHILERLIKLKRLNLQTKTPVTKISLADRESKGRYDLHTARGNVSARHVILATNAYTSALLPQFASLIVPVRSEMSSLLPPKGSTLLPNSYGWVGMGPGDNLNQQDDYLVQRPFSGVPNPAGHLMFGGGRGAARLDPIGTIDDDLIDEDSAAYLRSALPKALVFDSVTEGLQELKATHQWTGIWGFSRDNHPWVGAVPEMPGVWLSAGYTGHGMPNGTLCGKAVVEMVLGEEEGQIELGDLIENMVEDAKLPRAYVITEERMKKAEKFNSVRVQDETGWMEANHVGVMSERLV